jgi:dihydrofolate reductase
MCLVGAKRRRAMRTLITEFISLDGVVQAPGGRNEDTDGGFRHGGWSMKYFDPEVMGRTFYELAQKSDALLQGRRTYQVSASAWPQRSGDAFSDWINGVQKYVVSDTLTEADITWKPTTIIRGADLLRTVSELRERPGGFIYVYGSATMVRALLAADLVDELLLTIEPILLGGGKTIFPQNGEALTFELISTQKASTGAQVCRYQRKS